MSKVTITFEDGDELGTVNTQVEFEPAAQADEPLTPAQTMGLSMLWQMRQHAEGESEITDQFEETGEPS